MHIILREPVHQIEFLLMCYCFFAGNGYDLDVEERNDNLKEGRPWRRGQGLCFFIFKMEMIIESTS